MNENSKYCRACGKANSQDAVFCGSCGAQFSEPSPIGPQSPPQYGPVSGASAPPPRKIKKEYVIGAVAILAVLAIVGAAAVMMPQSTSPSATPTSSAESSVFPTLSATPVPTLTPLPANAIIKRGTVGDTLSQGGVTATLLSYNKRAPGYVDTDGDVWNNTSYNVSLDLNKPAQYFGPSSNPQNTFVWSDNYTHFSNMGTLSSGDNSNATYTGVGLAASRTGTAAYPVEFRMMLPTQSGDATYVFIWSLK
jgi:hypothetical protein